MGEIIHSFIHFISQCPLGEVPITNDFISSCGILIVVIIRLNASVSEKCILIRYYFRISMSLVAESLSAHKLDYTYIPNAVSNHAHLSKKLQQELAHDIIFQILCQIVLTFSANLSRLVMNL